MLSLSAGEIGEFRAADRMRFPQLCDPARPGGRTPADGVRRPGRECDRRRVARRALNAERRTSRRQRPTSRGASAPNEPKATSVEPRSDARTGDEGQLGSTCEEGRS